MNHIGAVEYHDRITGCMTVGEVHNIHSLAVEMERFRLIKGNNLLQAPVGIVFQLLPGLIMDNKRGSPAQGAIPVGVVFMTMGIYDITNLFPANGCQGAADLTRCA